MKIGSTVTLAYTGTLEDGTVFGFAKAEDPMKFQTGMDMVIDGFEEAILAMEAVGEKQSFDVDEYKGYGEYLDDFTARIPREQVPARNLAVGKRVWLTNSEDGAPTPATVLELDGNEVLFDLNHPLAGKRLHFEVEILDLEPAPEGFIPLAQKRKAMEESKLLGGEQGDDYR